MPGTNSGDLRNRILMAMPPAVHERISPHLKSVAIPRGHVIDHVDDRIEDLYFVDRGLVCVIKTMRDGRVIEVGTVGIEGLTDPNALFGMDRAVLEAIVEIPVKAFRIRREILVEEMKKDIAFRALMQNYARFAFGQMAQTAACNGLHTIEQRCCRWMLTAHDNAGSDTFALTQEFLSMMLGVQRTGISTVANYLRKAGLIDYSRGRITITDREGLELRSCECYADMRLAIDHLFRRVG